MKEFKTSRAEYIAKASTLGSYEDIKRETREIRSEIERSLPGYSQTIVGGASYGRPLSGTEIINRVARIGARYTDGRDYSKAKRIGIGLFEFSIDIENEYEKYMKTAPNPISYELFANVCGPYWEADLRAELDGEITRFFDNTVKAAELATIVYGGIYQLGGMNISMPRIGGGGMVSAPGIGSIVLAPVIEKGYAVSGAGTAGGVTVNAEVFANLAAACNEKLGNLLYQVYGVKYNAQHRLGVVLD